MDRRVDLPSVAAFTGIPHSTLRSWARRRNWPVVAHDANGRNLYAWPTVKAALFPDGDEARAA